MTNIKAYVKPILLTLSIVVFVSLFAVSVFAKSDPDEKRIAQLLEEMKDLQEENKRNECAENSARWNRLNEAKNALEVPLPVL